jgi:hypothetical protein
MATSARYFDLAREMASTWKCEQAGSAVLLKAPQPFADGGHGGSEESRGRLDAAPFGALSTSRRRWL